MKGEKIFIDALSKRDWSGNDHDEYAQLLQTLFVSIGEELYTLLEQAEKQNKKLAVKDDELDEITKADIVFI